MTPRHPPPRPPLDHRNTAEFRRNFLALISIVGAVLTLSFVLGSHSGLIPPLSRHQLLANVASVGLSGIVAWLTWTRPQRWKLFAWAQCANFAMVFVVALYSMPSDELRYAWFFIQVSTTFLLLGPKPGWVTAVAIVVMVVASKSRGLIALSDLETSTFCVALLAMAVVLHCHDVQASSYRDQIRQAHDAAKFAAEHDALTGLLNRHSLTTIGADLWRAERSDGFPISLIFLDIDHFKRINDRYGHHAGDDVIRAVASAASGCARKTDFVARVGGEEIVLLLPRTDHAGAVLLSERIRQAIEGCQPVVAEQRIRVTASIGWATAACPDESMQQLIQKADEAMYRVKSTGRNGVWPKAPAPSPAAAPCDTVAQRHA